MAHNDTHAKVLGFSEWLNVLYSEAIKISKVDICAYAYVRGRMRKCVGCLYNWLPVRGLLQNPNMS